MTVTPDLPDWWDNATTTSPHPPPASVRTATMAGASASGELIGVPPVGEFIRLWAISAGVLATAGSTGYIDIPIGTDHIICQVGQSLNLSFLPSGLLVPGTDVVVNTSGSLFFSVTAVYDVTQ